MSNYQLSKDQVTLLTKGLNFIPTPRKDHPAKYLQDILLFDRKIGSSIIFTTIQTKTLIHLKIVTTLNNQPTQYYIPAQAGPP